MSELDASWFFDDPESWAERQSTTEPPEMPGYVKGFVDIRPEVVAASGISIAESRIKAHSEADEPRKPDEGEQ